LSNATVTSVESTPREAQRHVCALLLIFFVLGCYWAVVIHQLGAQWSVYEQYHYGWAVPLLCVYLIWRRTQAPDSGVFELGAGFEQSVLTPATRTISVRATSIELALCAVAFAPTRLLHEANPIWRFTSFGLALEVVVMTLCFVRLVGGVSGFRRFLFPISYFLVAVPWPSGLENFLVQSLTRWNVAATVELLGLSGVPAIQHGNVIEIGAGVVGIDEACSGIRSLQATFMISLFLGEFYFLNFWRRVVCVIAGVALSFVFNVGRTSFLTWLGAKKGTAEIAHWHDPAGITILVLCFLSLWALARFLAGSNCRLERKTPATFAFCKTNLSFPVFAACVLGAWFAFVEVGTEMWFRSHEMRPQAMRDWSLKPVAAIPGFTAVNIPGDILGQFKADQAAHGLWRDPDGNVWQVYYFRWLPGDSLDKRLDIQLAKTHGPEKCLPAIGMTMKSEVGIIRFPLGGMSLALQQYLFLADGRPVNVFYGLYEDPSGSDMLANRRKDAASRWDAALAGSRNYGQRFLEIAITGPDRTEDATAALKRSLPRIIAVQ
jgi:exosortase